MRDLRLMWMCACSNWRKLRSNPVLLTLLCLYLTFSLWNLSWVVEFCFKTNTRVSLWIFPFTFLSDTMVIYYGVSILLLFASAPFADGNTPFLMIRAGKENWICGQVLYIWSIALLLPLSIYASELFVLLPRIGFSTGWGGVIQSIAADPCLVLQYGIEPSGVFISSEIISGYTPIYATMLIMLLAFAAAAFFGTLTLFLNVSCKMGSGAVISGVFVFWSGLSAYVGQILYGTWIGYTCPLSWISLFHLSPYARYAPTAFVALGTLFGFSLIFSALSVIIYEHRDTIPV